MRDAVEHLPKVSSGATAAPPNPAAEAERILLLECRLEKLSSALSDARADADRLRTSLAEVATREADFARRHSLVHQELAGARADNVSLHERLARSEALRAELEGHLFEAGPRADTAELIQLREELLTLRQRSLVSEQTAGRLRARVNELLLSREALLSRVAEWQRLVRNDEPGAVDLSEFIAELRRDIMHLEHRNAASERKEIQLRERLARAGIAFEDAAEEEYAEPATIERQPLELAAAADDAEPEAQFAIELARSDSFEALLSTATDAETPPAEFVGAELAGVAPTADEPAEAAPIAAGDVEREPEPVLELVAAAPTAVAAAADESAPVHAGPAVPPVEFVAAPVAGLTAADPAVRAAAYERLIRVFDGSPAELADHLRSGLADEDPRVRRRAVLAAATARRVPLRPLLDSLQGDPDPHVRRVVREVLRHAPEV